MQVGTGEACWLAAVGVGTAKPEPRVTASLAHTFSGMLPAYRVGLARQPILCLLHIFVFFMGARA
jgi:hypothetical protein